jgi:hypothetical protein
MSLYFNQKELSLGYISKIPCKSFVIKAATMRGGWIELRSMDKHDHHAFVKHKKAKQDLHPTFGYQGGSRRTSRAARGAPQYRESGDGDSSPSSDDDTEDYRVEHRKRKSTDRESDDGSQDDEEEIEEEEAPLV